MKNRTKFRHIVGRRFKATIDRPIFSKNPTRRIRLSNSRLFFPHVANSRNLPPRREEHRRLCHGLHTVYSGREKDTGEPLKYIIR